ncbi:MAG: hypothetical protein NTW64_00340 [Candidatus Omnitrophica bacterium]|nr:hypothetical protein [Candidatus Omnitrophota bacterium]
MKKYLLLAVCLTTSLSLNIYFRAFPINFTHYKKYAKETTKQRLHQEAIQQANTNFPGFSALAKDSLVKVLDNTYRKQKKAEIKEIAQVEYRKLKDYYQDATGQTYLMELDGWHWARYVDNILRLGHVGDKVVSGRQLDTFMLAPKGSYITWNHFLFYFSAFLYKLFSLIKPVPLLTFLFYLPLFFVTIFILVLYLFCYYHWGNMVALFSSLFVGLSPVFLARSSVGWFDTDIFSLLFPILIIWGYLLSYTASRLGLRILYLGMSSFWVGLFSFTWVIWWFIVLIIIVYEFYSLLNLFFVYWQYKEKNSALFKQRLFSLFLFLVLSSLWVIIFSGTQPLEILGNQVRAGLVLNKPLTTLIWPNVYSTVGELRKGDFIGITNSLGGIYLFICAVLCLVILFLSVPRNPRYTFFQREFTVIMTFWFIGMFLACLKGVRFTMYIALPLGISLFWMLSGLCRRFKNKKLVVILISMLVVFLAIKFIYRADREAKTIYPFMNDSWYRVLNTIREKTPEDAIINSWWDYGDWFKTVSKRRVIFDGQSQNVPQAYWMANLLMSDNEKEIIGILRMLNNGGNSAFEIINKYLKDPIKSVMLLKKVLASDVTSVKDILSKILPSQGVEEVIKLLLDKPDKAYFIVDSSMPYKINAISYLGSWDFIKVYITQNINKQSKEQIIDYLVNLGMDSQKMQELYKEALLIPNKDLENWISPKYKFYSGVGNGEERNGIVFFDNGIVYDIKRQSVYVYSSQERRYAIPKSLFMLNQDKLEEIPYSNNNIDFSVLIFKTQEVYQSILLDQELASSLLVRLFFMGGRGLEKFKPFIEENNSGQRIMVFEVSWD